MVDSTELVDVVDLQPVGPNGASKVESSTRPDQIDLSIAIEIPGTDTAESGLAYCGLPKDVRTTELEVAKPLIPRYVDIRTNSDNIEIAISIKIEKLAALCDIPLAHGVAVHVKVVVASWSAIMRRAPAPLWRSAGQG